MTTATKEVSLRDHKATVQYKGEPITITFDDVKRLICPYASPQEVMTFLKVVQSLNLNPFAHEVYLIKYSEHDRAAMVIAVESYLKSAEMNKEFDGYEAGIILKVTDAPLEFREGSFLLDSERDKLVGGWAKVYRQDRKKPFYMAVNKAECIKLKRDGTPTEFWAEEKQPSMLRKVALKRALVEAFPSLFGGLQADVEVAEIPEGSLPQAYKKNGEDNWALWWAKKKELGLSEDDVHGFLNVASLSDWLDSGKTLEDADIVIAEALAERARVNSAKEATNAVPPTMTEEEMLELVAEKKKFYKQNKPDTKVAKGWLMQVCKINTERIKNEPQAVYNEVAQLNGWKIKNGADN